MASRIFAIWGSEYNERIKRRALASEHSLVTVHTETGERVLFVSPSYVKSVVGLAPREGQMLLELSWEHVTRPEYTVRFKWNAGDIAFWDNRSTSHLAPTDIFQSDFDRQLYRITLVDSRSSVSMVAPPNDRRTTDPVCGRRAADDGGSRIAASLT